MPDTAVLPVTRYTLRRDRCVIEVSRRLPLFRARLTATGGHWTPGSALTVVLDPGSLRTPIPFLAKAFHGEELTFTAAEVAEDPFVVDGGVAGRAVRLRGDVRHRDACGVVVWAAGYVLPARRKPARARGLVRLLARRRLRVEIAIEFVR
ncbi:hypothetical protein [Amycolatopsis vancoresmycina]|uniref:Lipid/polyisoprenoid-binding YceI-like domain-containing protein n=1 Tax=Amycolatopsis vancoresmycina DSM 44592 TaxID=1292037 RepID=R1FVL4_9PSEU|nr:hypothetical protein [Amycolatopsis vancoresmycina]EOD63422.1 hypothetical protein H480_37090 [Amycolatopsis vancoresmycina DSM 44592]